MLVLRCCAAVLLAWLVGFTSLAAQEVGESPEGTSKLLSGPSYEGAVKLLDVGQWSAAATVLESVVNAEPSAAAYYQLAFAFSQQEQLGQAMWALKSSEALGGVAEGSTLRGQLEAKLPADQREVSPSTTEYFIAWTIRIFGGRAPVIIALLGVWLGAASMLRLGKRGRFLGAAVLLLGGLATFVAFRQNQLVHLPIAIVQQVAVVYDAPSQDAGEQVELLPGATVETGETLSGMTQVYLPTGLQGWIAADLIWPVQPLGRTSKADRSSKR